MMTSWKKIYFLFCALSVSFMAAFGLMHPWFTPDTASWIAKCTGLECFAGPRFPLYRILYLVLSIDGRFPALLVWTQVLLFFGACYQLINAASRAGVSRRASTALALTFPLSNMLLIWGHAEIPEILARAALLVALAGSLDAADTRRSLTKQMRSIAKVGVFGSIAYLLDPAQLPFIVIFPALVLWLRRVQYFEKHLWRRSLLVGISVSLPFLIISAFRLEALGSFNIVSFGGYEMSGLAAEIMTPNTAEKLPKSIRGLAKQISARKAKLVALHQIPATPVNSVGKPSIASEALGYFDIFARYYDVVLRNAVLPIKRANQSWVAFNAEMRNYSFAVVRAEPLIYMLWVAGAVARLVGRMLMLNLPFVLGLAAACGLALIRPGMTRVAAPRKDIRVLFGLTFAYTIGTGALGCLTAFPAQRYIDGADLLISVWPIYAALLFHEPS